MTVVALYNMKGGVGKTTAAVNLSYLAAAADHRVLLWDLDPQAASSFAFRVRPHVAGFKKSLESGQGLVAAIKETDYHNLDLLPADFAYRKLDRLLDSLGKPERVVSALLDTLGRDYDTVFLDCPAGFSLLTEGVFAAADAVLVPTIPTVLSLRTLARLIKWADRSDPPLELAAFFSMVDRRKILHRRACEWSASNHELFMDARVPYASVVELMAVRRAPLAMFAPRDPSTIAFGAIWTELQGRLHERRSRNARSRKEWAPLLESIESLIGRLESADEQEVGSRSQRPVLDLSDRRKGRGQHTADGSQSPITPPDPGAPSALEAESPDGRDVDFVHSFDTERRDLLRCGFVLQLRERPGSMHVIAARAGGEDDSGDTSRCIQAQIDSWWATQILSGTMSPLEALARRLGRPAPWLLESFCAMVGERQLNRIDSCVPRRTPSEPGDDIDAVPRQPPQTVRR